MEKFDAKARHKTAQNSYDFCSTDLLMRVYFGGMRSLAASHGGPNVFMNRLYSSIQRQELADLTQSLLSLYQLAFFVINQRRQLIPRKFVLRADGLYIDKKNTVGNSDHMNRKIFASMRRSSGVVFVSEYSKKINQALNGPIQKPYTIIRNAVPLNEFCDQGPNMRSQLGIGKEEVVFIASAHWRRHKRLAETINLFQLARERLDRKCKLLILGKNAGTYRDPDIFTIGEIEPDSLPKWYRTGDIFIHLAWIEPCGNTHIEAMACGLPVICVNNGGAGESVRSAKAGIVSKADQPYQYGMIDAYCPPTPDYHVLLDDLMELVVNLDAYKKKIDRVSLDIDVAAREYVAFFQSIDDRQRISC